MGWNPYLCSWLQQICCAKLTLRIYWLVVVVRQFRNCSTILWWVQVNFQSQSAGSFITCIEHRYAVVLFGFSGHDATFSLIWSRDLCDWFLIFYFFPVWEKKKKKILLFTNYGPTRGMNIHIYNYLKHNIYLTKTKIQ
jgi:hypothetical protein